MVNGVVEEKGVAPGAGARPTERGDLLEGITDDAAIVRTRRQMGIWQQHRLGRPGRRKHPRQAPWRGDEGADLCAARHGGHRDRKSTRLNSSHQIISYAVFCLKKKNS